MRTAHTQTTITPEFIDAAYGHVPIPAGATADEWMENVHSEGHSRSLVWRSYCGSAADLRLAGSRVGVEIDGRQQCDGTFSRHISLSGIDGGGELTGDQARAVAALLSLAADELDRLQ